MPVYLQVHMYQKPRWPPEVVLWADQPMEVGHY